MNEANAISLRALLRGAARVLPDVGPVNRGLLELALAKGERRRSIGSLLERQASRYPQRPALRFEEGVWTYAQFNASVNRFAAVLAAQGVGHGSVVAVVLENRPELLFVVAAAAKLGAVAGMVNVNQRGEVLAHSLGLIKPDLAVVGSECAAAVDALGDALPGSLVGHMLWLAENEAAGGCGAQYIDAAPLLAEASAANPPGTAEVQMQDPCFYIFTSGTTGMPKASVMTHGRWIKAMAGIGMASLRLRPDDIFYCALPLYHNNALTLSWGAALGAGATLALARKFSASGFWDDIRRHQATGFCYIGELCRYLLRQPPGPGDRDHRVRVCLGNGLRPDIWEAFKTRFGIERINEFYGASEGNLVFTNTFGQDRTAGFCPLSFAVVEFDAAAEVPRRDAHGRLIKVGRGGTGLLITEITERAPFDGYTSPEESEKKLIRDAFADGDCWFNTGDLVRDQGYKHIAFVDRLGDTFRWKGENVATTEVEAALDGWPQIEESVVYGIEVPHCDGRAGMAALTLRVPVADFDAAGLATALRQALPAYAVPLFLRLRAAHETTATFKLRKVELRREAYGDCGDPVFMLTAEGYRPLDAAGRDRIDRGEVTL